MMTSGYKFNTLKNIFSVEINGKAIWKQRMQNQVQYLRMLEDVFQSEIFHDSFGFYPNKIYFATSLTSDPVYTENMKPTWQKIIKTIERATEWKVYAPFTKTDPHSKIPDGLTSYQIRDLDHIEVLTAEVGLFDLNRPSHGVGQEIEMGMWMPKIGFANTKVSRMTKGMPGLLILHYTDEKELLSLLKKIFTRENYKKEPFYLDTCSQHPTKSIFKGLHCLHCELKAFIHAV